MKIQAFFDAIPSAQTISYCGIGNPKENTPLLKVFGYAVNCEKMAITPIVQLLRLGAPLAVIWLVIPVIINPIDRMIARGAVTNIGKKFLKRCLPLIAYLNAAAAIVAKRLAFRIKAAIFNINPCLIFRRSGHVMPGFKLEPVTAAGSSSKVFKVLSSYNRSIAALTLAFPHRAAVFIGRSADNSKKTKFLASSVDEVVAIHELILEDGYADAA